MKKVSIIIAGILIVILFLGPLSILKQVIFPMKYNGIENRVQPNTLTTNRIVGEKGEDISLKVSKTIYPIESYKSKPKSIILVQSHKWQDVLALMPLVNKYNSVILNVESELSKDTIEYIKNIFPLGISQLKGAQILVFGSDTKRIKSQLDRDRLKTVYINYKDTESLQKEIYNMPGISLNMKYGFIVKDNDPLVSITVSTWIANQGGVILYANSEDKLNESSKDFLLNNKLKKIYLMCDNKTDKDKILKGLKIKNESIVAFNKEKFAIKFAKFYDKEQHVGWNIDRKTHESGYNYILCSKDNPLIAVIGSQFAIKGKIGPVLWTDKNKLSPITENYLWRMKPNYYSDSLEGPYNSIWVVGNENIISYETQIRTDLTQNIGSYKMMNQEGISGIEVLSIMYILIAICGSIWISFHLFIRMKHLSLFTKFMWILTTLILGPIGLWIYIISYVNCPKFKVNNKIIWMRPVWKQVLVADITGLSFTSSIVICISYFMFYLGIPMFIFPEGAGVFLIGNPIIILSVISYVITFIINKYIFIPNTFMELKDISYLHAKREASIVSFVSVTSMFIGMIFISWWLSMSYSPRIPEENYILWWAFLFLSAFVGGIISYIPSWLLVKNGKQLGVA